MLSFFRKGGAAQVFGGAIVFAIIIVFVLEFRAGGGSPSGSLAEECAVKVKGKCIAPNDFHAAFNLVIPRGIPPKQARALELRAKVLEGLVERELLLLEAKRLGISISGEEIDDSLFLGRAHVSIPVADLPYLAVPLRIGFEMVRLMPVQNFKTKKFDYTVYERVVRNLSGRSAREFKEIQRAEMVAARVREAVRSRVRVSDQEALLAFRRERSKAVIRVAKLPRDWFGRYVADISDEVVDAWADSNSAQVDGAWKSAEKAWKAGCPLMSEIFVQVPPAWDDDQKVILRDKIEQAKKRVDAGEDFAAVARQMSEGPTAPMGGELGCMSDGYGEGHETLLEAAKGLQPGEASVVLETKKGFHIVLHQGVLAEGDVEKVARRVLARRMSAQAAADTLAKEFGEKLMARAKEGGKLEELTNALARKFALRAYAKEPKEDEKIPALEDPVRPRMEVSAPFTRTSGAPVLEALPTGSPPEAIAFQLEKEGAVHPELILTRSGFAVMQLKEKTTVTKEDFEKEKGDFLRQLTLMKQSDALTRYVASLRKANSKKIEIDARFKEEPKVEGESPGE